MTQKGLFPPLLPAEFPESPCLSYCCCGRPHNLAFSDSPPSLLGLLSVSLLAPQTAPWASGGAKLPEAGGLPKPRRPQGAHPEGSWRLRGGSGGD